MSSSEITVSIIMPSYNRDHIITGAIRSVLNQSYKNWELLVIDDGSTDRTAEVVETIAVSDRRIRYEKLKKNSGVSAARNKGISLAKGKYIAYLDSDNYMYYDWLECMLDYFERNTSISWLYPRLNTSMIDRRSKTEQVVLTESIIPSVEKITIDELWSMEFQADPNGLVHERTLVANTGIRWDEEIESYGDYDYALQLSQLFPEGFAVHPFALGKYIRIYGENGMCSSRGYKEIISGLDYLQRKHVQFTAWTSLNDIDNRISRYTKRLQQGMRPIDGLREKYRVSI